MLLLLEVDKIIECSLTPSLGCFWGLQLTFQRVPGVVATEVGYTQGHLRNPVSIDRCLFLIIQCYEDVWSGTSGHTEAVRIEYDPDIVSFSELLIVFWDRIDPTTKNNQGNDFGSQYRSGIYYHNQSQMQSAIMSREKEQLKYIKSIVTEILPGKEWFRAEDYHQRYLEKGGQCAQVGDISSIRCYG